MVKTNKVLIVGAGPVGLLLAISLKRYGIDVSIIDKIPSERNNFSKALTLTSASLKAFHGLDIIQDFLIQGKKMTRAEIFFDTRKTASVNKNHLRSLYNFYLGITQPETERILEAQLKRHRVEVQYQKELIDIQQHEEEVQVTIKDLRKKQVGNSCFNFVVGCDGAHSSVRKILQIPFIGEDYNINLILGDVIFHDYSPTNYLTYHINDHGFIVLYPLGNGYTRVVGTLKKQSSVTAPFPSKEELQILLDVHFCKRLTIKELVWSSSARLLNRIAQSNYIHRVFLAGDAFHLFSSVGGQAMNTGFQDVIDLGWRLSHFLQGTANKKLLDDYPKDRMIAVQKVLAFTDLLTKLINGDPVETKAKKRFQPSFANRGFYRNILPNQFAGYWADYSKNSKSLVGKHVPYVSFQQPYHNLKSTYELPQLKKHALFILGFLESSLSQELTSYKKAVVLMNIDNKEVELIKELGLSSNQICMISPGGYIVAHGPLSEIVKYLATYY